MKVFYFISLGSVWKLKQIKAYLIKVNHKKMLINIFEINKNSPKMIMLFRVIQRKANILIVSIIPNWNIFTVINFIRTKNHNFHRGSCLDCNIPVRKHHTLWKAYTSSLNFLKRLKVKKRLWQVSSWLY